MLAREELVNQLKRDLIWDVIVIGGGAAGLGAALESASRGYKTLLLEQYDFTIGTSSRSTKLVHGGVRYLAQGDILLVLEALKERGILLRNAPHLVTNQSFLIPSYKWWYKPFYTFGLTIYDWLSGRLSFGRSRPYSKEKTISMMPNLIKKNLRGSILYHDGQFDDSRLGLNLVQTIIENGGVALNYFKVENLLKTAGKISGVVAQNMETGEKFQIKSRAVINATGVFVDNIIKLDDFQAKKIVKPSQGVHIVIDKEFLNSNYALMIPKTNDGRVLFAVPWHNKVILGTTDVEKDKPEIEPQVTDQEVDFILETAGRYLEQKPTRADIKSVFAGLRPLAAPEENEKTKEISRKHKVIISPSGLVSVVGGKWTTFRDMGEDVIDKVQREVALPKRKSVTEKLPIHGYTDKVDLNNSLYFYGADISLINSIIDENKEYGEYLSEELKIIKAQVVLAVRNEYARQIIDVLARRTRALFLDAKESIKMAPEVAKIMAQELNYDQEWQKNQVEKYKKIAQGYLLN